MKIDCLEQKTASILIFRMMCQLDEDQGRKFDLRELFKMPSEGDNNVDIKVTVNGVEVDPIKCLETCRQHLESAFEQRVGEVAKEMVSLAGLDQLREKIRKAKYEISEAIDNALEKVKK